MISRTIKDQDGKARYEFVSTAGIPKKQIASLVFCSYYMISHIPRAVFDLQDRRRYWRRIGDMVRLTGVHVKLQMILKPMSGFRVRMLMFQTLFHMKDMMGTSDLAGTADNEASSPSKDVSQGAFDGNAEIMSRLVIDDEGDYTCFLSDKYQKLFEKQIKNQEDLEFHDLVSRMRLTLPNTFVLSDTRFFVCNRKRESITKKWSHFKMLATTVKYPPVTYGEHMERVTTFDKGVPDRKIFCMFIITPAKEQVEVPTGLTIPFVPKMSHVDQDDQMLRYDSGDDIVDNRALFPGRIRGYPRSRFGSVVSDSFKRDPTPGPSTVLVPETPPGSAFSSEEEGHDDSEDSEDTSRGPATRSKGKGNAKTASPEPDKKGVGVSKQAEQVTAAVVAGLEENRRRVRMEREEEKKKKMAEKPPDHKITSRWADDQGLLYQPTINLWFKEMPKAMMNVGRRRFRARG